MNPLYEVPRISNSESERTLADAGESGTRGRRGTGVSLKGIEVPFRKVKHQRRMTVSVAEHECIVSLNCAVKCAQNSTLHINCHRKKKKEQCEKACVCVYNGV